MRLRRALFLFALPVVACEAVIGLDDVKYGLVPGIDGPDGTAEAASPDGSPTDPVKPVLDGSVADAPSGQVDADSGPFIPPGRPDSSAGNAGVVCSSTTCGASQYCCVDTDGNVTCRSGGCSGEEASFRCDDPFDCAAANKGCCTRLLGQYITGSSCETTCASHWYCVTTADCPKGLTCGSAPVPAPGGRVCQ